MPAEVLNTDESLCPILDLDLQLYAQNENRDDYSYSFRFHSNEGSYECPPSILIFFL